MSVWRLSVAYIVPKSRTERYRKTKIGTEVAHITRDLDTTFKVKGQGHQAAHRRVGASGGCSNGRQNVLAVGNCCYVAVCSAMRGISAPTGEEESGGCISWSAAHLQLVYINSVHGANHLWGESSLGRDVHGAKRPWGETSMGRNVLPWGEVSMGW